MWVVIPKSSTRRLALTVLFLLSSCSETSARQLQLLFVLLGNQEHLISSRYYLSSLKLYHFKPAMNLVLRLQLSELPYKKEIQALAHLLLYPRTGGFILCPLYEDPKTVLGKPLIQPSESLPETPGLN